MRSSSHISSAWLGVCHGAHTHRVSTPVLEWVSPSLAVAAISVCSSVAPWNRGSDWWAPGGSILTLTVKHFRVCRRIYGAQRRPGRARGLAEGGPTGAGVWCRATACFGDMRGDEGRGSPYAVAGVVSFCWSRNCFCQHQDQTEASNRRSDSLATITWCKT
jgi:hypothetical protein